MMLFILSMTILVLVSAMVGFALHRERNVMLSLKVPGAEVRLETSDTGRKRK